MDSEHNGYIPLTEKGFWKTRYAPTQSLSKAAELFNELKGKILVEVGTGIHPGLAGNSVLVWTEQTNAERIIAVDIDGKRLEEVCEATKGSSNIELVLGDGIEYLDQFQEKIDLLYLDFWVSDRDDQAPGEGRAEAYKLAYIAAKDKMNYRSIILIDDTDHISPWKHTYIVPLARKDGYTALYTGRQTLLKR